MIQIIAEIPTNPRVEVPDLIQLEKVLSQERKTLAGQISIDPVFILDQTFCPNIYFLGEGEMLSTVRAISYASGSKFPSGGQNPTVSKENTIAKKIEIHLFDFNQDVYGEDVGKAITINETKNS